MIHDEDFLEKNENIDFNSIGHKVDSGIRWNSTSLIYSAIIQIIMMIILARLFTPEEYGIMGLVLIIIGFGMTFSDAGISAAVIHYQKVFSRQLSTLFWLTIIIGFLLFLILNLLSPLISLFFNEAELTPLIRWTSISFLIIPLGQLSYTLLQKNLIFKLIAYIEILTSTIYVLVSILLAYYSFGVISIVIGYICKVIVSSFITFFFGLKIWIPTFKFQISGIGKFMSFGLYQMGERTVNYFNTNIDKIVIGKFLGTISLGYYNIAYNLILYPIILINPIFTRVYFPYFSKMQNNLSILKEKYFNLISIISFINFPIYFLIIIIAPYFIPLVYGIQWYPSIILVQILSIVGLLKSIGNPIGSLLLAKGYARLGFLWNSFITLILPFTILIGIYFGGINEVAIFLLLSHFLFFYFFYSFLIKKILGPCLKEYIKSFGIYLIFSICASSVSLLGGLIFQTPSYLYQSLYLILIGSITYLCLIFIFRREFLFEFIERFFKN